MFTKLRDFKTFPIHLILNLYFDINERQKEIWMLESQARLFYGYLYILTVMGSVSTTAYNKKCVLFN